MTFNEACIYKAELLKGSYPSDFLGFFIGPKNTVAELNGYGRFLEEYIRTYGYDTAKGLLNDKFIKNNLNIFGMHFEVYAWTKVEQKYFYRNGYLINRASSYIENL